MTTSSLGLAKNVWYKRPWFLVTAVVVVIAAISIISDLPRPLTKAQDAASQNGTIKAINNDLAECAFAVHESFNFYNDQAAGTLTASNRAQIPALLVGDQTACSFASQPIYDLTNNIQVLDTAAGKHIDRMKTVVLKWMTDNALASIEDIQYVFAHPGATSKVANLTSEESQLATTRALARSDLKDAEVTLGLHLDPLKMPALPHLRGT